VVLIICDITSIVLFLCSEVITKYKCYRHDLKKAKKLSSIIQIMCKYFFFRCSYCTNSCVIVCKKRQISARVLLILMFIPCVIVHMYWVKWRPFFLKHFSHFQYYSDNNTNTQIKQALTTIHTHR